MGFSVSGSAAIVFIGVIVAAGIAIPSIVGSLGSLAGAQGQQTDRGIEALNTDFDIENTSYNATRDELDIRAKNTGSTSLSVNDTSVLVDGVIPSADDVTTDVEGDANADLWLPGETLNVTVERVEPKPDRVKVVTENGIAETAGVGG
jgi:flagellar protein FlaF